MAQTSTAFTAPGKVVSIISLKNYADRLDLNELDMLIEHKRAALNALAESVSFELIHPAVIKANRELNDLFNTRHSKDPGKY